MPSYQAVVWVLKDDKFVWKGGMSAQNFGWVTDYACRASDVMRQADESGFVIITDYASGKEIQRIKFEKAAKAVANGVI